MHDLSAHVITLGLKVMFMPANVKCNFYYAMKECREKIDVDLGQTIFNIHNYSGKTGMDNATKVS